MNTYKQFSLMSKDERNTFVKDMDKIIQESIHAYESANNRNLTPPTIEYFSNKEVRLSKEYEAYIAQVFPGIEISWPGLYPSFNYEKYEFHTLESLFRYIDHKK